MTMEKLSTCLKDNTAAVRSDAHTVEKTLAVTQLYDEFRRRIYSHSYRLLGNQQDADDITQEVFVLIFYDNASASPAGYMKMLMVQAKRIFPSGHLRVAAFLRLPNESTFSALSHTCRKDMPSRCSSMLPRGSRIRKLRSSSVFRRMLRRHASHARESCLQKSISVWVVMLSKNRGSGCEKHRYASGLQDKERRNGRLRRL